MSESYYTDSNPKLDATADPFTLLDQLTQQKMKSMQQTTLDSFVSDSNQQRIANQAYFSIDQGLPSMLNTQEILVMILRELKCVGAAIAGFNKVQQSMGQSFINGIKTIQESLIKQQSCQQCKQMTSDTSSCNECYKRMCLYCQKNLQIAYRNCLECRGLFCSSHQN